LSKKYTQDPDKVEKVIGFIEHNCGQTKGVNGLIKLTLPQKVWLEAKYGLRDKNGDLLCKHLAIIMGRGSGKTTFGSAVASYDLLCGGSGSDVQIIAPTKDQANICYDATESMLRFDDTIFYTLKIKKLLRKTRRGLLYDPDNSLMRITTADIDTLDGGNCYLNVFDEIHAYKHDYITITNEGSENKRKNWCSLYLSTYGTQKRPTFYNNIKKWKDWKNLPDNTMPYIYQLEDIKQAKDPKNWEMALPNIYEFGNQLNTTAGKIKEAERDPVALAEIYTKRFNLEIYDATKFFNEDELNALYSEQVTIQGTEEDKAKVIIGIDLSEKFDLASICFIEPKTNIYNYLHFKPENSFLTREEKNKFINFKDNSLIIHEHNTNDTALIKEYIGNWLDEHQAIPVYIGYDKWQGEELTNQLKDIWGIQPEPVTQNSQNISAPLKDLKERIMNKQFHTNSKTALWGFNNALVKVDSHNNIYPVKEDVKSRIDPLFATLDALYMVNKYKDQLAFYM